MDDCPQRPFNAYHLCGLMDTISKGEVMLSPQFRIGYKYQETNCRHGVRNEQKGKEPQILYNLLCVSQEDALNTQAGDTRLRSHEL